MALGFPLYFPNAFLEPVVQIEATAEREFRAAVKAIQPGAVASVKHAATKYIVAVACAFAHQACEAARARDPHVPMSRVAKYAEDFLGSLSVHVYYELTDSNLRRGLGSYEGFEREIRSAVLSSDEWDDHLAQRASLAEPSDDVALPESGRAADEQTTEGAADGANDDNPRLRIDAFIQSVLKKTGRKVRRHDIWRVAGYTEATEFERFQRGDGTPGSVAKFNKVLQLTSTEFLNRLHQLSPKPAK